MRAVIFDLDGTLVDTVYAHTLAWQRVLGDAENRIEGWKVRKGIAYGIATSGKREDVKPSLSALDIPKDVVVVDRSDVERAKPEPDLFLACQEKLKVRREECYVVGDAVWDLLAARRAGMLGIGLLSGGYGEQELAQAGAYRVYANPAELLGSIYQLGLRGE
jgi:HAD superfamily hydrolase (TIGR01662 family)